MPPSSVHSVEMHVQLTPAQEREAGKQNKQGMHGGTLACKILRNRLPDLWETGIGAQLLCTHNTKEIQVYAIQNTAGPSNEVSQAAGDDHVGPPVFNNNSSVPGKQKKSNRNLCIL